ncbi:MAG: hypothetical protein PHW04_04730 [Candidatus Wallbacteria bacterium]|nr:hypothetical protein [Candidatus Wallbacteria bacterium]
MLFCWIGNVSAVTLTEGLHLLIRIDSGLEERTLETTINQDQGVLLPLISGRLDLNGLTLSQAEAMIADIYKNEEIYRSPKVEVSLIKPAEIEILGQLLEPGRYLFYDWSEVTRFLRKEMIGKIEKLELVDFRGDRKSFSIQNPDFPLSEISQVIVW